MVMVTTTTTASSKLLCGGDETHHDNHNPKKRPTTTPSASCRRHRHKRYASAMSFLTSSSATTTSSSKKNTSNALFFFGAATATSGNIKKPLQRSWSLSSLTSAESLSDNEEADTIVPRAVDDEMVKDSKPEADDINVVNALRQERASAATRTTTAVDGSLETAPAAASSWATTRTPTKTEQQQQQQQLRLLPQVRLIMRSSDSNNMVLLASNDARSMITSDNSSPMWDDDWCSVSNKEELYDNEENLACGDENDDPWLLSTPTPSCRTSCASAAAAASTHWAACGWQQQQWLTSLSPPPLHLSSQSRHAIYVTFDAATITSDLYLPDSF